MESKTADMLAADVSNPAQLVQRYGEVQVHWAHGASLTAAYARTAPAGWDVIRHGWVSYLELARIRELTAGEDYPGQNVHDKIVYEAGQIGAEAGRDAASWVFDGNTNDETYAWVLRGIEEGDPAVLDAYREPDLSGEWADSYSEEDLANDLGLTDDTGIAGLSEQEQAVMDEAATAWADSAREAFWHALESTAREHVRNACPVYRYAEDHGDACEACGVAGQWEGTGEGNLRCMACGAECECGTH